MSARKYAGNYSIENIAQSIARDRPDGRKYDPQAKQVLYADRLCLLEDAPELKKIFNLENVQAHKNSWCKRIARTAVIPPEMVVVDERIQDMCSLPFWKYYGDEEGSFSRCAGVGAFSCCPPFTLAAEKVQARLDRSDIFVVLQTKPARMMVTSDPGAQFRGINLLADEVSALLGEGAVVQKFGGGPCFACFPDSCEGGGKCNAPHLKVPSLESMGICVDQLCKDLAALTGDDAWKITWIRGFGTPDQTPKRFKGVAGLAIRLKP